MATKTFILSHDNRFNKSVIEENAFYFSNSEELVSLLKNENLFGSLKIFKKRRRRKTYDLERKKQPPPILGGGGGGGGNF